MLLLLHAIGYALCVLAVIGALYSLLAAGLVARFMRRAQPFGSAFPAVTLIKPLHGAPPGLMSALESFCRQDYPGDLQIVFGVQDAMDPAIGVIRDLQRRHPALDIELTIDARLYGTNRKVSNLINIAERARHGVLVMSDADIRVGPGYLRDVVGALGREGVGAASCLYVGVGGVDRWSTLSAMAINYQFLPSVALGKALGLARPCFGSTIAMTAEGLRGIGGFEAFADHLADDYEIGRAVRALGQGVAVPPLVVSHLCGEVSAGELIGHELRWNRTVRQIDAAGHAGSVITHPLPVALIGAALLGLPLPSLVLIFTIVGARIAAKFIIDAATGARAGPWWLVPARDVLSFGVFCASFAVNTVGWQGRRFRIGRDGLLAHP
ncbi:MAG: bacteriohopanetetrol glucosamine biosynthesis glycosyltransferase HpnI [Caulobacteraceae bacterium]